MFRSMSVLIAALMVPAALAWSLPAASADEAVDKAFDVLKTYDWGHERGALDAIDKAVAASHGNAAARTALEARLSAVLSAQVSNAAKDFVCRKLSLIGSAHSVPALAALLTDKKLSHMARYALERMPCPQAVKAMRDALPKVRGPLKVGVINSLGVRRDAESTAALIALLGDKDQEVLSAAAAALGAIGSSESAKVLGAFQAKAPSALRLAAADAYLACGERLLADGKTAEAMLVYKALSKPEQPKHVRLAAMRGLLAVTGKK